MNENDIFIRVCQLVENYRRDKNLLVLPNGFLDTLVRVDLNGNLEKFEMSSMDIQMAMLVLQASGFSEEQREILLAELESKYEVSQEKGGVIKGRGLVAWDVSAKLKDSYYWHSLRRYWVADSPMSSAVIQAIDEDTSEILSWCGNPDDDFDWKRTGLVMGHVQSGKTTNFSALINKAFDAGYNHVVVLAGLTNSLRRQTQERLDETVLGRSSESDLQNRAPLGVAQYRVASGQEADIIAMTRETKDFNQLANDQLDMVEGRGQKILWVVKKNVKVLESLNKFLTTKLSRHGGKLDLPLLVIDDEADNASVDTKYGGDKPSAINQQIRLLLHTSRRYSYVGYTATPFANIFIDPELSDDQSISDELFPRDFIKSLEPAENYIGPHKIFNETHDLYKKCVVNLDELEKDASYASYAKYSDHIKPSHKSSLIVEQLPQSLKDAILLFVLICSYRIMSKTDGKHTSMLINVSLYNAVQIQISRLVDDLLSQLEREIINYGSRPDWRTSQLLARMETVFNRQGLRQQLDLEMTDLLPSLESALARVTRFLVNMSKESRPLVYGKSPGKFVLAIGGLALSRGLTLEGLVVSYIIRNVGAKDTLLQTARWFGYRDGYAEICRIFMPGKLEQRFLETADTVEELREDLSRMVSLNKTPAEFGLRVRHSGFGLSVTAPTKMGAGKKIVHAADFSARHAQYADVYFSENSRQLNQSLLAELIGAASDWRLVEEAVVARRQPMALVTSLLASFNSPHPDFELTSSDDSGQVRNLLNSYIAQRAGELAVWDIVVPFSRKPTVDKSIALHAEAGLDLLALNSRLSREDIKEVGNLFLRQRFSGDWQEDKGVYRITKKGSVADTISRDLSFSLDAEERQILNRAKSNAARFASLPRPVLFVHCVQVASSNEEITPRVVQKVPLTTISLCFPGTTIEPVAKTYVANPVFLRQLEEARSIESETEDVDVD